MISVNWVVRRPLLGKYGEKRRRGTYLRADVRRERDYERDCEDAKTQA